MKVLHPMKAMCRDSHSNSTWRELRKYIPQPHTLHTLQSIANDYNWLNPTKDKEQVEEDVICMYNL